MDCNGLQRPAHLQAQPVQDASQSDRLCGKPGPLQKVGAHQVVHRLPGLHNLAGQVPGHGEGRSVGVGWLWGK